MDLLHVIEGRIAEGANAPNMAFLLVLLSLITLVTKQWLERHGRADAPAPQPARPETIAEVQA